MSGGEVCQFIFNKVVLPSVRKERLDIPAFTQNKCCFTLPVLAEVLGEGDNQLYNDKTSVLGRYDKYIYSDVVIVIQKYENGNWVDKANLEGGNLGTDYEYGQLSEFGSTDKRLNYVGSIVNWQLVMYFYGEGTYRFKFVETLVASQPTESIYPFEFCLKTYMPHRADRTTRFEWYTKGFMGDYEDDTSIWDFVNVAKYVGGEGWFNQLRLPDSFFGGNKSEYSREFIRYQNGQQVWLQDEQIESYQWHSGMYPAFLHDWIKTNIIQADRLLVTDYNKNNPNIIVNKAIKPASNYEPNWNYNNLNAMVSVDFEQEFQNRRKRRC